MFELKLVLFFQKKKIQFQNVTVVCFKMCSLIPAGTSNGKQLPRAGYDGENSYKSVILQAYRHFGCTNIPKSGSAVIKEDFPKML